ncbi:hypothetical protein [Streptomyces sp. NPDC004266]|uniref:hypothetical protein n=1 Tax=Streptomyces sp. NPDC004266 TaxID=3364693 RepID=UPI0036CF644F
MEQLRSIALLDAPPEGAAEIRGYEGVEAECREDSGDAAVSADHMYVHPGTPGEVIRHYRTAAGRDGWLPGPSRPSPPGLATGSGFLVEARADAAGEPIDCED